MIHYKVVTHNMESLGLRRNPNILKFPIGEWVYEGNPLEGKDDFGGIWVAKTLSGAKGLIKYLEKKGLKEINSKFLTCKIFEVEIGKVLYGNDYRIKTDKVKLIKEWMI